MENIVKGGYLKKGNSAEGGGGVFSNIIEKMTPRKWYILIVRNRVPFLEQYDRDVDVFSGVPIVSYNLSTCTSICRTMSTTARTFSFIIVCPEELIELIASSREQMVDWCNTLERTLGTLGILKREKEEHIYTFCPAVVNSVGRSQSKPSENDEEEEEEHSDEELGAVGGAHPIPALPPPRSQALPPHPVPDTHPPPLPRMLSEPAYRSSPSPPPSLHPPVLKGQGSRSASPSETSSTAAASSAPPSPHVSVPLLPTPAAAAATKRPSSNPPPLPKARASISPSRVVAAAVRPPPLPPGRPPAPAVTSVAERSLPPVPSATGPASRPEPAGASDSGEEEEESDYSSDFVSGAFWEINRKTPVPTARHAKLPPKTSAAALSKPSAVMASGAAQAEGGIAEDLDEGYTDLSSVSALRQPDTSGHSDDKKYEYTKVKKKRAAYAAGKPASGRDGAESADKEEWSTPLLPDWAPEQNGVHRPGTDSAQAVSSPTRSENELVTDGVSENFYAPFPGENGDSSMTSSSQQSEENCEEDGDTAGVDVCVVKITTSPAHHRPDSDLPQLPGDDVEQDCMYASACEASTLFPSDPVPPLPPRQDSLSSWKVDGESSNHTGAAAAAASSAGTAVTQTSSESPMRRPIPRRRTVHTSSQPVTNTELENSLLTTSLVVTNIPPLPPPRRGIPPSMCQSMMEGIIGQPPPPLPARRTHSVHGHRPVSFVAPSSSSSAAEADDSFPTDMSQSFSGATSLTRQQSFGNGDTSAAENHLRQRMRLDRGHSIHSVISLKQSQAEILRQEMDLPGVTVTVTTRAAQGIAVVDCADAVCIVGWNQKDFPSLHGKFHIGDQLISIANVKVTSAAMTLKMLKHPPVDIVEMLVKRTPYAKVMAIRRVAEGQSIGIKRNGGTAEILYVDPNGLASANGLPLYAPGVLSGQRSNWVLTEINSRHLNLFFKDNEIEHRLNAVGREITIVVQPFDYITELKRQLKKIKNYKNYIVQ